MDPRTFTVKPCPAAYAAKSSADIGSAVSNRRDFGQALGKIGDLQVLNSIGGGAIGTGLRTVASVSNSIRTGCGALPSVIGDSIDQGANWILGHIGMAPDVIQSLKGLNPDVANRAWGQAQQIYDQVKQGHFKATDIPYYLQDLQDLERLARGIYTPGDDRLNALSSACEASPYAIDLIARAPKYKFLFMVQFITAWGQAQQIYDQVKQGHFKATDIPYYLQDLQDLERLARGIYTPGDDRLNALSSACEASPYAIDLIARAPKYKFLFMVQFITAAGYSELDETMRGMAFVVKKSTRPKVTYQTENVNYYNYRTKLITKTEFDEMTMSFHDDTLNNTMNFYASYLKAMTPIANLSPEQAPTQSSFEQQGMSFVGNMLQGSEGLAVPTNKYAASLGPLNNDNKQGIFKETILYHVFNSGTMVNVYHFINPRITQLVPDDVDMMVGNEGTELSINFSYDTMFIETKPMQALDGTFRGAQSDAFYQLRYNDAASATQGPNTHGINPFGLPVVSDPTCDPLNSIGTSNSNGGIIGGGFGGAINKGMDSFMSLLK